MIWKWIDLDKVNKNMYKIYENGDIFSCYLNDFMSLPFDKDGYLRVALSGGSRKHRRYLRVANLVGLMFWGNPPCNMIDPTINHIDNNKINNHYLNLEWMERSENLSLVDRSGDKNSIWGKKRSEITKQKLSKAHINKKSSEEANKKKGIKRTVKLTFDDNRILIFETTRSCAEFLNISIYSIQQYGRGDNGKPKHYCKYKKCFINYIENNKEERMEVILYTTHCSLCEKLECELKKNNKEYQIIDDVNLMVSMGFDKMPVLKVDNNFLDFKQAIIWAKEV